jgi:hypothetical protein
MRMLTLAGAIAPFWTLNPDYFEGVSLAALANRLGLHKAILSAQAAEARRKFGFKNRSQALGWNFGKAEAKRPQTPKGGALAEAAMSRLKARFARNGNGQSAHPEWESAPKLIVARAPSTHNRVRIRLDSRETKNYRSVMIPKRA